MNITIRVPSSNLHTEADALYTQLVSDLNETLQMDITWEFRDTGSYYTEADNAIIAGDVPDIMVIPNGDITFMEAASHDMFWDLTD